MLRGLLALTLAASFTIVAAQSCGTSCAVLGCDFYEKGCPCQCSKCVKHNDCCSDWDAACDGGHGSAAGPDAGPEQHHLSLTASPSEMVVSFATSNKPSYQATPICTLVAPDGSNVTFSGASHTYTTNVSSPWQGLLHTVRFTGLTPSQRYKYTCRVGSSEGAQHSFLAAPPVGYLPVTVAVVGDMGEGCNMDDHGRDGCANATIARLQADVAKASDETSASAEANNGTAPFSLLVHVGDIAYTGGVETVYDGFLNELEPVAASVPYQVCVGNHEHYFNFSGFLARFAMSESSQVMSSQVMSSQFDPNRMSASAQLRLPATPAAPAAPAADPLVVNNLFYSFDYGGVHFVAYSTEHDLAPQLNFISADLAAVNRTRTPWVVAFAHRPVYCSTNDHNDCDIGGPKFGQQLEPLFSQFKVDLALFGHLHNYERTWPVYQGQVSARSYANPSATVHAVVGMAGDIEGLTDDFSPTVPSWSAVRDSRLGYARLHFVSASRMSLYYTLASNGSVADEFTITK
jgi:hypothetical protein